MGGPKTVQVAFLGDIMLHSRYDALLCQKGPEFVFARVREILGNADLVFANLETVLCTVGGIPAAGKLCLRGDYRYIDALRKAGVSMASLANNHCFDYGADAFREMAARLEQAGILVVGAGDNLAAARTMKTVTIKERRFGFLAYCARGADGSNYAAESAPGVAPADPELILDDIRRHKGDVDHLVISLHWGVEYSEIPDPAQVSFAHGLVDAGAQLVVGHHPHILQGWEQYGDGQILYSLGNFCDSDLNWTGRDKTYQWTLTEADREGVIVLADFAEGRPVQCDFRPLRLNEEGQPEACEGEQKQEILDKIKRRSEILAVENFEKYWETLIIDKRVMSVFRRWFRSGTLWDKIRGFRLSQLASLWELARMYCEARFSRSPSRYYLIDPGKDSKPRPGGGPD